MNQPLAIAHYLEGEFQQLLYQNGKNKTEHFFDNWNRLAEASLLSPSMKFFKIFSEHWHGSMTYCSLSISNTLLESSNNKIKAIKCLAYGLHDNEFFKLVIDHGYP